MMVSDDFCSIDKLRQSVTVVKVRSNLSVPRQKWQFWSRRVIYEEVYYAILCSRSAEISLSGWSVHIHIPG